MPDDEMPSVDMTQDPVSRPAPGDHPYWQDLNPDFLKGENYGEHGPHPEKTTTRTAYDVKGAHDRLRSIEDDDLKEIPILPAGSRLEQGAVYFDLRHPEKGPFKALGGQVVGKDDLIIAKQRTDYEIWNRLVAADRGRFRRCQGQTHATRDVRSPPRPKRGARPRHHGFPARRQAGIRGRTSRAAGS